MNRIKAHARGVRASAATIATVGLLVLAGASPSFATTPTPGDSTDLTGGSGDTFFTSITSYFQDHLIGSVLALLALVVGVGMAMGWGKKAAKSK